MIAGDSGQLIALITAVITGVITDFDEVVVFCLPQADEICVEDSRSNINVCFNARPSDR